MLWPARIMVVLPPVDTVLDRGQYPVYDEGKVEALYSVEEENV